MNPMGHPMQQQQMIQQQGGMMPMEGMPPQQMQYGGQQSIGYGGPQDSSQVQRLLRPMHQMQPMHGQQPQMMPSNVVTQQQQQQHMMQMQQHQQLRQQQQPQQQGQQQIHRPQMVMMPQQAPGGGVRVGVNNFEAMPNQFRQLPTEMQTHANKEEQDSARKTFLLKTLVQRRTQQPQQPQPQPQQQQQQQQQVRPQQAQWHNDSMGQQPPFANSGNPSGQTMPNFSNQIVQSNQPRSPYPQLRHPSMPSAVGGQGQQHMGHLQQQPNITAMPGSVVYRDNMPSANPPTAAPVQHYNTNPTAVRQMQNVPMTPGPPPPPQQPQMAAVQQQVQGHNQMVNQYPRPATPSSGGSYPASMVAPYPSPSTALGAGPSPVYAPVPSPSNYSGIPSAVIKTEPSPAQPNSVDPSVATGPTENITYKEKIRELQIYMDHLKWTLEQQQRNGVPPQAQEKVQKMIDILEGRHTVSYETLLKCEDYLKKQSVNRRPAEAETKGSMCQPFLDAVVMVAANKRSANAILKRTFAFPWNNLPTGVKRICLTNFQNAINNTDETTVSLNPSSTPSTATEAGDEVIPSRKAKDEAKESGADVFDEIPLTIQREVASLEPKFRINLDKTKNLSFTDEKTINVLCDIEDSLLPLVPPLKIRIPLDYPMNNPKYNLDFDEYVGTPLFDEIKKHLNVKFSKLSGYYSITTLLHSWETCVRQAFTI